MPSPASTLAPTEISLGARAFSRDGFLFLGLGAVAVVSTVGVVLTIPPDKPEALTGLAVGSTSSAVFWGAGLWKLFQARRAGLHSLGKNAASIAIWFYAAFALVVVCGYLLPRFLDFYLRSYTDIVSWSLPMAVLGAGVFWKFRRASDNPVQRAACAIILSFLGLIYGIGVGCGSAESLLYGQWGALSVPTSMGFMISGLFFVVTLWQLRLARRLNVQSATAIWLRKATWLFVGLILTVLAGTQCLADYWGMAALVLFGVSAFGIGSLLSGIRQGGAVSHARQIAFTLPLALAALLLALAAELMGSALTSYRYYYFANDLKPIPHSWIWHAPDGIRGPMAAQLARIHPNIEFGLYAEGLIATADLKREALNAAPKNRLIGWVVWKSWVERDSEALTTALAVPPLPPGSSLANTAYDWGAGSAIGIAGTHDDICTRLKGGYSAEFIDGILSAISPQRARILEKEIAAYFQNRPSDFRGWHYFALKDPTLARATVDAFLRTPSPSNYGQLHSSSRLWRLPVFTGITDLALRSDDATVRKIALENTWQVPQDSENSRILISIAMGQMPHSDPNERRAAASLLSQRFFRINTVLLANYKLVYDAAPVPLTPGETLELQHICKEVENRLPAIKP